MAAIQKIRKHNKLLLLGIGGAMLLFLLSMVMTDMNPFIGQPDAVKVAGGKLSAEKFQERVEQVKKIAQAQKRMQAEDESDIALTDAEELQIRQYVAAEFERTQLISREAGKLGLTVTDKEYEEALKAGRAQSLTQFAAMMGLQQFNLQYLQTFLKEKEQQKQQLYQMGNSEAIQQMEDIESAWGYTQQALRDELLVSKYSQMLLLSIVGDQKSAQAELGDLAMLSTAEVAAVPFSTVDDKSVKVTDDDLKAAYDKLKGQFYIDEDTRDVKLIRVQVTPSTADQKELTDQMNAARAALDSMSNVGEAVGANTLMPYSNFPLSRQFFERKARDVAQRLDSVAVGSTLAPFYGQDRNGAVVTTFKLVGKEELPDSVLVRFINPLAQNEEAYKKSADSIYKALCDTASFADVAKKYDARLSSDSTWFTAKDIEKFGMSADDAEYYRTVFTAKPGETKLIKLQNFNAVVQVRQTTAPKTKYNVAAVRRYVEFSDKTFNTEQGKLNQFLAKNKTAAQMEKNAMASGYNVETLNALRPSENRLALELGRATDLTKWIFDEAEAGDVSVPFTCGSKSDYLVVAAVTGINKAGYLPWDNAAVKATLTKYVQQQKKAEMILAKVKNVKSIADAKAVAGAVSDTVDNVVAMMPVTVAGINVPEALLAASIAKTAEGGFTGAVVGAGAVYFAQVTKKTKNTELPTPAVFMLSQIQREQATITGQTQATTLSGSPVAGLFDVLRGGKPVENAAYKF